MGRWWSGLLVALMAAGCERTPLSTTAEPLVSQCRFDEPADGRPVLAVGLDDQLVLFGADGSRTVAWRFDPAAQIYGVVSRRGRVAASAGFCDGPQNCRHELVLLDERGAPRWHRLAAGWIDYSRPLSLNDRGELAVTLMDPPLRGLVIAADGAVRTLDGVAPVAAPAADGALPVYRYSADGNYQYGWLDAAGGFTPTAHPHAGWQALWEGERLVYVTLTGDGAALVTERPGDARVVPLPGPLESPMLATRDGWALVYDAGVVRFRVRLADGLVRGPAALPSDLRLFEVGPPATLDDGGALVQPLRGTYLGALYRDDGDGWRAVGGGVRSVLGVDWSSRGGTFVIAAGNARYGGELDWPPLPVGETADLDGPGIEIARPAAGTRRVVGEPWYNAIALSADGKCAAWWNVGTLEALDAERDRLFKLDATDAKSFALGIPVWIE